MAQNLAALTQSGAVSLIGKTTEICITFRPKCQYHCHPPRILSSQPSFQLGKGFIGLDGFRAIVASKELQHINLYAETDPEGVVEDIEILKKMRG